MKRIRFLFFLICFVFILKAEAQTVDTVVVYSPTMKKEIKNVVILPADYKQQKDFPVVYLLHGYGGQYDSWVRITKPELPETASGISTIIVCPDGANSWYWDSPLDSSMRYETYISQELTGYVDKHYKTRPSSSGRAICGYSMGGHGALWLAFRHPDIFGAAGSMSGGLDIRPFPDSWEMKKSLGEYHQYPQIWETHTVMNSIPYTTTKDRIALIIDCGSEDFFYEVNCRFHEKLLYYHIPHEFISRPGNHSHKYWKNAVDYQFLFFDKFFKSHTAQ